MFIAPTLLVSLLAGITPPRLDDRHFDDLVAELMARIPAHTPEWTDHEESDPGATVPLLDELIRMDVDTLPVDELWCAAPVPLCTLVFETPEETVEIDVHYQVGQWVPWVGPRPDLTFELVEF